MGKRRIVKVTAIAVTVLLVVVWAASYFWAFGYQQPSRRYEWFFAQGNLYVNTFPPGDVAPEWARIPGFYISKARLFAPLFPLPEITRLEPGRWHVAMPLYLPLLCAVALFVTPHLVRLFQRMGRWRTHAPAPAEVVRLLDEDGCPRWDEVTHEVACSRCDYDLRGLREARCPECGITFDWPSVLDPNARRVPWLFEHRWAASPWRTFASTFMRACLPWRLWRGLRFTDRIFISPLAAYFALWSACLLAVTACWLYARGALAGSGPTGSPGDVFLELLWALAWSTGCSDAVGLPIGMVLLAWIFVAGSLLSLMLFRQTLGRCRIRTAQLLRVVVYAATPLILGAVSGLVWPWIEPLIWWSAPAGAVTVGIVSFLTHSAGWILYCASLAFGLQTYLKVRRGWLMVVASQLIVLLGLMNLSLAYVWFD